MDGVRGEWELPHFPASPQGGNQVSDATWKVFVGARVREAGEAHTEERKRGKGAVSTDIIKPDLFVFPQDQQERSKMKSEAFFFFFP